MHTGIWGGEETVMKWQNAVVFLYLQRMLWFHLQMNNFVVIYSLCKWIWFIVPGDLRDFFFFSKASYQAGLQPEAT